jgi:hypothetical protein
LPHAGDALGFFEVPDGGGVAGAGTSDGGGDVVADGAWLAGPGVGDLAFGFGENGGGPVGALGGEKARRVRADEQVGDERCAHGGLGGLVEQTAGLPASPPGDLNLGASDEAEG